jgi:outer membrane protein assembly factor BamD
MKHVNIQFRACLDLVADGLYRTGMSRRLLCWLLIFVGVALLPFHSPAPLIYTPGEGWTYEPVGGEGKWQRTRAKEQLQVAQQAYDQKDYGLAIKAARHVVKEWPLSDYAPRASYLLGRCYEARRMDQRAFDEYQNLLTKYPQSENINEVLQRQYIIAGRFLDGEPFKLWNHIPYPSFLDRDRTASMFEKVVKSAPYSDVAPQAQMKLGATREKQKNYTDAVAAYELAADRYSDRPDVAAEAMFRAGMAYRRQAQTAEYDQGAAGQAIASFTDFMTLYPDDQRVPESENIITSLKAEQARGNFEIAKFYEKRKKWNGALIYYNEVLLQDPNSPLAPQARERIDTIKKRLQTASR